jgi:hypothetical protein
MRVQGGFILSDRSHKEAIARDRFQRTDSEADGHRVRELMALLEQLSWRTYLEDKSRPDR